MIYARYRSYKIALDLHKKRIDEVREKLRLISEDISLFLNKYDSNQRYSNKDLADGQGTAAKRKANKSWQEKTRLEEEFRELIELEYQLTKQLSNFYSYSFYWFRYRKENKEIS